MHLVKWSPFFQRLHLLWISDSVLFHHLQITTPPKKKTLEVEYEIRLWLSEVWNVGGDIYINLSGRICTV